MKLVCQRNICTTIFTAELFTIAKKLKQLECPLSDRWTKKTWHIYTMKFYLSIKKNEILSCAATRMSLEVITLSEISQTQKDKV
jgi:hypothetical protein